MNLPTTKTPPQRRDPRIIVLYGAPKVGKTTILSQLPDCLIVDNEHGTDYIEALKVNVDNVKQLKELATELHKHPMTYKRIALDTITTLNDWAEELAIRYYTERSKSKEVITTVAELQSLPYGEGYRWCREAFKDLVKLFSGVTGTLILVAHMRDKELTRVGGSASATDIDLTGKVRQIVTSLADTVGYLFRHPKDNTKLLVRFAGDESVVCSSRCEHLKGQTFEFDWKKIFIEDESVQRAPTETIETFPPVV